MAVREYERPPGTLGLYARAAAPLLPLATRLPFVGGRGDELPDLELRLPSVEIDRDHLARYCHVCGFTLRDTLPATYAHVLAFPLHMALITDASFPFAPVGLVHIANEITVKQPLRLTDKLSLSVRAVDLAPHPRGRVFTLVTQARVGRKIVWEGRATNLRRGGGGDERRGAKREGDGDDAPELRKIAEWPIPADIGRRYAAVSGDRNPIHMHDLSAKLFGFPRAIAHGMWTKARCLAALENRLPDTYTVSVRFRKPVLLPAKAAFAVDDGATRFALSDAKRGTPHLDGGVSSP